jgi:hypothetical protein
MTNEKALEAFNTFMCNAGLVLIRKEDIQRIRDLAEREGILEKLQALNILVHAEFAAEEVEDNRQLEIQC